MREEERGRHIHITWFGLLSCKFSVRYSNPTNSAQLQLDYRSSHSNIHQLLQRKRAWALLVWVSVCIFCLLACVYFVLLFESFSVDNLYLLIKYCRCFIRKRHGLVLLPRAHFSISTSLSLFCSLTLSSSLPERDLFVVFFSWTCIFIRFGLYIYRKHARLALQESQLDQYQFEIWIKFTSVQFGSHSLSLSVLLTPSSLAPSMNHRERAIYTCSCFGMRNV